MEFLLLFFWFQSLPAFPRINSVAAKPTRYLQTLHLGDDLHKESKILILYPRILILKESHSLVLPSLPLSLSRSDARCPALRLLLVRAFADRRIPLLRRLSSKIWLSADQLCRIYYSLKVSSTAPSTSRTGLLIIEKNSMMIIHLQRASHRSACRSTPHAIHRPRTLDGRRVYHRVVGG